MKKILPFIGSLFIIIGVVSPTYHTYLAYVGGFDAWGTFFTSEAQNMLSNQGVEIVDLNMLRFLAILLIIISIGNIILYYSKKIKALQFLNGIGILLIFISFLLLNKEYFSFFGVTWLILILGPIINILITFLPENITQNSNQQKITTVQPEDKIITHKLDKKYSENFILNFILTVFKKSIKPYLITLGVISLLFMVFMGPARFISQWFVRDGYGANVVFGFWIIDYLLGLYLATTFFVLIIHTVKTVYKGGAKVVKMYKKLEMIEETKK